MTELLESTLMDDEVETEKEIMAPNVTWEEKQKIVHDKIEELLGDQSSERALREVAQAQAEAAEYHELVAWYTDAYDEAVVGTDAELDTKVASEARRTVSMDYPEKFARLRELESRIGVRNAKHQAVASAAHASVIEANLKNSLLWV